LESANKLAQAGAEFFVCTSNTNHLVFDKVTNYSLLPIPWLHIAQPVLQTAKQKGLLTLGLMGTTVTMTSKIYEPVLESAGIKILTPNATEMNTLNSIIYSELVQGIFRAESIAKLLEIESSLRERGCDGIILGFTELPIVMTEQNTSLPLLDSTRLLGIGALEYACQV